MDQTIYFALAEGASPRQRCVMRLLAPAPDFSACFIITVFALIRKMLFFRHTEKKRNKNSQSSLPFAHVPQARKIIIQAVTSFVFLDAFRARRQEHKSC